MGPGFESLTAYKEVADEAASYFFDKILQNCLYYLPNKEARREIRHILGHSRSLPLVLNYSMGNITHSSARLLCVSISQEVVGFCQIALYI